HRRRYRDRHGRARPPTFVRPLLHHQARREGNWPRTQHSLRYRPLLAGRDFRREPPGRGLHVRDSPAALLLRVLGCRARARSVRRRARRRTILVVEDELAVRQFTVQVLTSAGHQVLQAASAEEALLVAAHYSLPIHLLLTDMVMPGLNGRELAGRIGPLHPEVRVLLVSGYSEVLIGDGALDEAF